MSVASLLNGRLVKSRLDADLKDEWEVVALNASCLHPGVGQPGDEEVPQVERQLGDDGKNAKRVDQKPSIEGATEANHFLRLSEMSNVLVAAPHKLVKGG